MSPDKDKPGSGKKGKKVRVDLRRNRLKPRRVKDWTEKARDAEEMEFDATQRERVRSKGDLSRRRTIMVGDEADQDPELIAGVVVAMRGLFADVDDGKRVWPCTVRRVLRTRLIEDRHPVTVGDRVSFRPQAIHEGVEEEGVIERVQERTGQLRRRAGRRVHTVVANVDYALIVSSAAEPEPKPHLIDRYIIASLSGDITPVICMNKIDLDIDGYASDILDRYEDLGYRTLQASARRGDGIDELGEILKDSETVLAGQSGVGKSSLLNAVQPGLSLRVGDIVEHTQKGRHTTTTATLIRLDRGGYVVDTPGVKSFDIATVPINELEEHFIEFQPFVPRCKFSDCTHTHEAHCAVKSAVDAGDILPERYDSYARLLEELKGEAADFGK